MYKLKQHIVFKIATLLVIATILIPYAVKFTHVFNHHQHDICLNKNQTHLHNLDLECSFYKFNINTPFVSFTNDFDILIKTETHSNPTSTPYNYLISHWQLSYSLRGPPAVV